MVISLVGFQVLATGLGGLDSQDWSGAQAGASSIIGIGDDGRLVVCDNYKH